MPAYIVTSHPHEHRIVILGRPVDLVRRAEDEPPSARLTDEQAEHVRSWPSTLSVPRHEQDPLGRWRDLETGELVTPDRADETREVDHPYALVERDEEEGDDGFGQRLLDAPGTGTPGQGTEVREGETGVLVSEGRPGAAEVTSESGPFVDSEPGGAPAEEE